MADVHTKEQRSRNMAAIKSRGNKTTEQQFLSLLKAAHIHGWRRHYKILGKPDFAFPKQKTAVFIDGCFWHGCKSCFQMPKQNQKFWRNKINQNQTRDRLVNKTLKKEGWHVLRIHEHELKKPEKVLTKVIRLSF